MKEKQTRKAKEEFYSPIIIFLKQKRTVDEIADYMLVSNRKARDEVNGIGKHYPVIRGSFQKGYRLARPIKQMDQKEKETELELIDRSINEFWARIQDMKKTLKPLIAYKKVLEKEMNEKK